MMERWTAKDQVELERMLDRKRTLEAANMAPLIALVKRLNINELARDLADNAESLRDALEPFDSGVRPSAVEGPAL